MTSDHEHSWNDSDRCDVCDVRKGRGTWKVRHYPRNGPRTRYAVSTDDLTRIASVTEGGNAALISAAPEMYMLLLRYESERYISPTEVRAVLDKADGR